jgi:hypothetical protein
MAGDALTLASGLFRLGQGFTLGRQALGVHQTHGRRAGRRGHGPKIQRGLVLRLAAQEGDQLTVRRQLDALGYGPGKVRVGEYAFRRQLVGHGVDPRGQQKGEGGRRRNHDTHGGSISRMGRTMPCDGSAGNVVTRVIGKFAAQAGRLQLLRHAKTLCMRVPPPI